MDFLFSQPTATWFGDLFGEAQLGAMCRLFRLRNESLGSVFKADARKIV